MLFFSKINLFVPSIVLYDLDNLILCIPHQDKKSRCLELNNGYLYKYAISY